MATQQVTPQGVESKLPGLRSPTKNPSNFGAIVAQCRKGYDSGAKCWLSCGGVGIPDDDFDEAVKIAQAEFDRHYPDVVVGSSRGGAVAMNINSGETAP